MKIATVVGARPQFIKASALSCFLKQNSKEILIHTGQHYDQLMSDIFFSELGLSPPDYNLAVGSSSHGVQTGKMLAKIEQVLFIESPDLLLVYGDTNSTLAGALAAAKLKIPVAHIEAGLRSFNRAMPEEVNRVLTDHIASQLFCPTQSAVRNLSSEGIEDGVFLVGDIMIDVIKANIELANQKSRALESLCLRPGEYILVTLHRAENVDDPKRLNEIVDALNQISEQVVWPIHPRTLSKLKLFDLKIDNPSVKLIGPQGYLDMLTLESNARIIMTDSGGMQKEACYLKVPCLTLRDETEWIEAIEVGANKLVGCSREAIAEAILALENRCHWSADLFGEGNTAKQISDIILAFK